MSRPEIGLHLGFGALQTPYPNIRVANANDGVPIQNQNTYEKKKKYKNYFVVPKMSYKFVE